MFDKLQKVLQQEDTVLFIGSGVSLWSGLPSWKGLITELITVMEANGLDASLVRRELGYGDLLQAASYGFDKLTPQAMSEFIRMACRLGKAVPGEIHEAIVKLGPTCYITTNYDKLLELSFQKWKGDRFYRTIVNRQLTESASIVGAREKEFLFKLHGDAEDSASIILTREQYRKLHQGGELFHAMESVKTLMLSRPIIYIGFGLRDPDFLYLKDLLINTYKGTARDHYAIMADVTEEEKDYWKRNFGIYLVSYTTLINADQSRDHGPLLRLLEDLGSWDLPKNENYATSSDPAPDAGFLLSLSRLAARNMKFDNGDEHLPLLVRMDTESLKKSKIEYAYRYGAQRIEKILDNESLNLLLLGMPGGGKSYSLKSSVTRLSKVLNEKIINDNLEPRHAIVPIYIDLKLYRGRIEDLVKDNIPSEMKASYLCQTFPVRFYFDAFNEVPREYLESNHWATDFQQFSSKQRFSYVISSRTSGRLENLQVVHFELEAIDKGFIESSLIQSKVDIEGLFKKELIALLQKPLFYKLASSKKIHLDADSTPKKIYTEIIDTNLQQIELKFEANFDLKEILSQVAYEAFSKGEEAFKVSSLYDPIAPHTHSPALANDIINGLISQNFLSPLSDGRICFFHQSITEYLAAIRLEMLFKSDPSVLPEILPSRRWDHILFFTFSLLEEKEARDFLHLLTQTDFGLALSSVKYYEGDTTTLVSTFLSMLETGGNALSTEYSLGSYLRKDVPISKVHIPMLQQLTEKGGDIGGGAAACLLKYSELHDLAWALSKLEKYFEDGGFCEQFCGQLEKMVTSEDPNRIINWLTQLKVDHENDSIDDTYDFIFAMPGLLKPLGIEKVYEALFNPTISLAEQKIQIEIICAMASTDVDHSTFKVCLKLLQFKVPSAVLPFRYLIDSPSWQYKDELPDYSLVHAAHIRFLITMLAKPECKEFAFESIALLCEYQPELTQYVHEQVAVSEGIIRCALYYAISCEQYEDAIFSTIEATCSISENLTNGGFELLSYMHELNWNNQKTLFFKLLHLKVPELASSLLRSIFNNPYEFYTHFDLGPIDWWLDWVTDLLKSDQKESDLLHIAPMIITGDISSEQRLELIRQFNDPQSPYRAAIGELFLDELDISQEEFTEESIDYLIDHYKSSDYKDFYKSTLILEANDSFICDRIIPLYRSSEGLQKSNLESLLRIAGRRNQRRYLLE